MKTWPKRFLSLTLAASAFGFGYLGYTHTQNRSFALAEEKREEVRAGLAHAEDLATAFRSVGKVVEPSVVNINVRKKGPDIRSLPIDPEDLRKFFPKGPDGEDLVPKNFRNPKGGNAPADPDSPDDETPFEMPDQIGTGSGVIMEYSDGKGYILTNNHVAGAAEEMIITLSDGREIRNGKLLGTDPKTDLAVVQIDADRLSPAKWGNSDDLQKGDWIMAFGSPFGYVGSMTHGIVSALNRQAGILGMGGYEAFIQVDAPINPGNSGGPLVNLHGEVVGINTAIASHSGGFQGIGFAIPSNQAKFIYTALKDKGKVTRGWLGVGIRDVAKFPQIAKSFDYDGHTGVIVDQIIKGTPATGKLQPGDIITAVNGKDVESVQELRNAIAAMPPGAEVKMKLFRGGNTENVIIKLGEQPDNVLAMRANPRDNPAAPKDTTTSADALGVKVQTLTPEIAKRNNLDLKSGAVVMRVTRNSPAARAGLVPGDVITQIGKKQVETADDLIAALEKEDLKKGVRLYVTNGDASRFVVVTSEK
ncbi:MAG TPA: trypsin-like peptidase domain-containing protein [Tepidisphaeraceae bacterium]|jgi:serine protease Do|nr:trypsin-like peptidase domain-containing protein [Tepidisphaeraceae bacterium]